MSTNNITFGSTSRGFVPRQMADIQIALNNALALITHPETGERPFQNATDDAIHQQVMAILAEEMAEADNSSASGFLMRDPLSATGAGQSSLSQLNGILRKPGSKTVVPMELVADPGIIIPAGSQVSHPNMSLTVEFPADVVIPLSGTITVYAFATEMGPFDPAPDTIAYIVTPVPGWESARNRLVVQEADETHEEIVIGVISVGTNEETDAELRRRQQLSTNATSYRQVEAIYGAIADIPGVTFVRIYLNSTVKTDHRGIPGNSIACVVVGGDDQAIADAILFRGPVGVGTHGNVTVNIRDNIGVSTPVQFTRPLERLVWARVGLEIVVDEDVQLFPSNGDRLVKEAIVDFSLHGHSLCEPLGNSGFVPGQDIVRSYLYTPINSIGGAKVTKLELGERPAGDPEGAVVYAEQDIVIAWNEIGLFDVERIRVNLP